jgi:t-SNARE complex subunit (syntaxin)
MSGEANAAELAEIEAKLEELAEITERILELTRRISDLAVKVHEALVGPVETPYEQNRDGPDRGGNDAGSDQAHARGADQHLRRCLCTGAG